MAKVERERNAFLKVFYGVDSLAPTTILYNSEWEQRDDRLSVPEPKLEPGEIRRAFNIDAEIKILIIGTSFGNIVLWENKEYAGNFKASFPIPMPRTLISMLSETVNIGYYDVNCQQAELMIGTPFEMHSPQKPNIGTVIESIIQNHDRQKAQKSEG